MEIKSSTSLRNQYNEISDYCRKSGEPVYLTKNGDGDLVVMSIEAYEKKQRELALKEKILEVEYARLHGTKDYSIAELDTALKTILGM